MDKLVTQIRKSKGMNMTEFAKAIGVSVQMVSLLESGQRKPGRQTLAGLFAIAEGENKQRLEDALLEAAGVTVLHPTRSKE